MKYRPLNVADSIAIIGARRPALEPILKRFQPLLEVREEAVEAATRDLRAAKIAPPRFRRERSLAGEPLLEEQELEPLAFAARATAGTIIPVLTNLEPLKTFVPALERAFADDRRALKLYETALAGDELASIPVAKEFDLPPEVLNFVAEYILSTVLRALVKLAIPEEGGAPWNEEGVWSRGYCPVCGDAPVIAWLDRPDLDEKNAFLVGGGGKKNFYCSLCGASWKFRRGVCPSCGAEGPNSMEILKESGAEGERIDVCSRCQTYCPTIDLREFADVPNMDVAALGMLHLDIIAAAKNLRPLRRSFWNVF